MDSETLKRSLHENQLIAIKHTLEDLGYDPGMCFYRLSENAQVPFKYLDVYFMHLLIRLRVNSEGRVWYDGTYAPVHSLPSVQPFTHSINTLSDSKGDTYAVH